jgi:deoxyribose-phosphate aldolase
MGRDPGQALHSAALPELVESAVSQARPDDLLVDRIVARVRKELQLQQVPASAELRGTWQDQTALRSLLTAGADRIGTSGVAPADSRGLARSIDHTLLKPTATRADIVKVCTEAVEYSFASVCVNSTWIGLVAQLLRGSPVMPICVVGFPLGAASTESKAYETRRAIADGAEEIDMVVNIGWLKGGDHDGVFDDIRAVVEAAQGRPVKVILETAMLERDEKVAACVLSRAAGAAFVKTSTGFGGGGATAEDIALMRAVVGPDMGVKASGGVRNADDVRKMIAAGATRIGASASVAIVTGGRSGGGY